MKKPPLRWLFCVFWVEVDLYFQISKFTLIDWHFSCGFVTSSVPFWYFRLIGPIGVHIQSPTQASAAQDSFLRPSNRNDGPAERPSRSAVMIPPVLQNVYACLRYFEG